MSLEFTLYLICQLDKINSALEVITTASCILSVIGIIISVICKIEGKEEIYEFISYLSKICLIVFCAAGFLYLLTPTTKSAAIIYVVPSLVNNTEIQNELGELYEVGKESFKEILKNSAKGED